MMEFPNVQHTDTGEIYVIILQDHVDEQQALNEFNNALAQDDKPQSQGIEIIHLYMNEKMDEDADKLDWYMCRETSPDAMPFTLVQDIELAKTLTGYPQNE
jgi:hypothetical protein